MNKTVNAISKRLVWPLLLMISASCLLNGALAADGRKRISSISNDSSDTSDIEAEISFGRELAARILGNYRVLDDNKLNRYVNLVGKGLALYAGRPELNYFFGVLDTDEINAFATPGGYVFITKGALTKMDDEAQLASVLGHEIGHIVKKHVVNELNIQGEKGSSVSGLASIIGGATSSFRVALDQALDQAMIIINERGYKIEDEIESDSFGVLITHMAGYDPAALKTFLTKVKGFEKPDKTYTGDHPVHEVRIGKIDETIENNGLLNVKNARAKERFNENVKK